MQAEMRNYMGAIALNNSGVLLLERGRHRQALTVLRDALAAIRGVTASASQEVEQANQGMEPCLSVPRGRELLVDEMLRRASRYVMESAPTSSSAFSRGMSTESHVLDVDMPQLSASAFDEILPSVSGVTLIRIDAVQCRDFAFGTGSGGGGGDRGTTSDDEDGNCDADLVGTWPTLESITILHNFCVAVCLHPFSEARLRRGAVRSAHLAFFHVCRLLCHKMSRERRIRQGEGGDDIDADVDVDASASSPFEDVALLQMSLLLARCNYRLCVELGDADGAGRWLGQYRIVQTAMDSAEVRFARLIGGSSVPHAKAA